MAEEKEESRIIGEGSRACVYSPPLSCQKHPLPAHFNSTAYVSKLVLEKHELELERQVKARFQERKVLFSDFAILIEDSIPICEFAMTPALAACFRRIYQIEDEKVVNSAVTTMTFAYNGVFRNGGTALTKYPGLGNKFELFRLFVALLRGLRKLHSVNVYHMDIKLPNILLNSHEIPIPLPRIIDFGSCLLDTMPQSYIKIYDRVYINHPLFLNLFVLYRDKSAEKWKELTKELRKKYDYQAWAAMGDDRAWKAAREKEKDGVSQMLKLHKIYGINGYLSAVVNPNLGKVDAYMLAYTIDTIFDMNPEVFPAEGTADPGLRVIREVITQMLNPNIFEQWGENEALEYLTKKQFIPVE